MGHNTLNEMKEVIVALKFGNKVQFQQIDTDDEWQDYAGTTPNFFNFRYRVKPAKKWRPYKDVGEFLEAAGGLGAIWLKSTNSNQMHSVTCIDYADKREPIRLALGWETFESLLRDYTFADGRPCGIEEDA